MKSKLKKPSTTHNFAHLARGAQLENPVGSGPFAHLLNMRTGVKSATDVAAEIIAAGRKRRGEA